MRAVGTTVLSEVARPRHHVRLRAGLLAVACAGLATLAACMAASPGSTAPDVTGPPARAPAVPDAASGAPDAAVTVAPSAAAATATAPAEEPPPTGAIVGDAGTCTCIKHRIEWGGTACMCNVTTATISSCRTFTRKDTSIMGLACTGTISCDPTQEGSGPAIERIFAHPDIVRALARAPIVFGRPNETREGSDGVRLVVDGKAIFVFGSCANAGDRPCEEAPPGVGAAIRYLRKQPVAHDARSQCL